MQKFSKKWAAFEIAREIALFIKRNGICKESFLLLTSVQDAKIKTYTTLWLLILL